MSVEFFGVGGPGQIGGLKKVQQNQSGQKSEEVSNDKVQFSSVLQNVNQAQATGSTADTERAERIAELKAQIQNGSYEPDLQKVSSSLLQFLVESE